VVISRAIRQRAVERPTHVGPRSRFGRLGTMRRLQRTQAWQAGKRGVQKTASPLPGGHWNLVSGVVARTAGLGNSLKWERKATLEGAREAFGQDKIKARRLGRGQGRRILGAAGGAGRTTKRGRKGNVA